MVMVASVWVSRSIFDAFLGFDRLVQAVAPAAAGHQAAGVLVHDDDLVFLHDVLHVELVKAVGLEQLRDGVDLLRLGLEIRLDLGLGLEPLARIGFRAGIHFVKRGSNPAARRRPGPSGG